MPNRQIIVDVGDVYGVITRKKKGVKAVLSYRGMMVIYTHGEPPIYRGRHGVHKSEEEIDTFLMEGVHPYVEFTDTLNLTVYMDGYIPIPVDLSDKAEVPTEPLIGIKQPNLTLPGKLAFLVCMLGIVGLSLCRLFIQD